MWRSQHGRLVWTCETVWHRESSNLSSDMSQCRISNLCSTDEPYRAETSAVCVKGFMSSFDDVRMTLKQSMTHSSLDRAETSAVCVKGFMSSFDNVRITLKHTTNSRTTLLMWLSFLALYSVNPLHTRWHYKVPLQRFCFMTVSL